MSDYSMQQLERDVAEEVRGRADELRQETYPEDMVMELADGWVPIYTYDILQYAANDLALAVDEPECGPAFDGSPTPINIIAANIWDRLQAVASEALYELQEEWEQGEE